MKAPHFEVYQDENGQHRWRLKASNGRTVATGESHPRKRDAIRACQRVADLAEQAANVPLTVTQECEGAAK
jgi:hypothetical protein